MTKPKPRKVHPAAELFPMMTEKEFAGLKADIKDNGQHDPIIVLSDGRILDGRNRDKACRELGLEPEYQLWDREDDAISPTAWVISKNLVRRHLNESQIGMVAADSLALFELEAKARQRAAGGNRRSVTAPGREAIAPLKWRVRRDGTVVATGALGVEWAISGDKNGIRALADDGAWRGGPFLTTDNAKVACESEEARRLKLGSKQQAGSTAASAAASAFGIGARTVERAKALKEKAPKAELDAIRSGKKTLKQVERETKRADQVRQVRVYVPPQGEFSVISTDPSWKFDDELDGSDEARGGCPYPPMELEEICALKIPAAKDCLLLLWITNMHLLEGAHVAVLNAWGFKAKALFTWNKVHFGAGRTLRNVTEHCIFAIRGRPIILGESTSTLSPPWPRSTVHSEKPKEFYEMIEKICPATSRLEMFARAERAGWVTTGAELAAPVPPPPARTDPPPSAPNPTRQYLSKLAETANINGGFALPPAPAKKRRKLLIQDVEEPRT